MTVSRSSITCIHGVVVSLASVATLSYLGKDKASYGAYFMWMHIGVCIWIGVSAVIAWLVRISVCGNEGYGYFGNVVVTTILILLSMPSIPWLEFKYRTDRTINWAELKEDLFNWHYAYMFLLNLYLAVCASFQCSWEFWYLDGLEAGPLVMGGAALVRRSVIAMSVFTSTYAIKKVGDLYTVCSSFVLMSVAFLCLSFTRVYWYVLAIGIVQGMGIGLAQGALVVHFSKAGSRASSGFILGLQMMCYMVGIDAGAAIFGILFDAIGTRKTLLVFSLTSFIVFASFLFYLQCSKQANMYKKLPDRDNECSGHDDCNSN